MSKRLDITILKLLAKQPDTNPDYLFLDDLIKEHGYDIICDCCNKMKVEDKIKFETINAYDHEADTKAKINPKGRDYLLNHITLINTRNTAWAGVVIAVVAIILSLIGLTLNN